VRGKHLEADFIATGHYAQVVRGDTVELHKGLDPDKDQSYVLYGIRRAILPRLMFPIGGMAKADVRVLARDAGLCVADKPDSVEICFVPDGDHASLVRRRRPDRVTAGNFVDTEGNVLAEHDGYDRFTIGQRKGLGYAGGSRRYVLEIVPETREVILGDREQLLADRLNAGEVNWLVDPVPTMPLSCVAKIRYRHSGARASVTPLPDGRASVTFETPQAAVAPGQAVVFYDGTRVLGGGWIM
jgi:tRNA-specific 2-thiouridylase